MWSHQGDMVRQRQSVWIQGIVLLIARPTRYKRKKETKRKKRKEKGCGAVKEPNEKIR